MQNIPDVSVIIPTRGRPQLLQRALRSVLAQTLQTFEVVVVHDGPDSSDRDELGRETRHVVQAFKDERLRLVELPQSVGGAEARNVGVRHAIGRYIALLDDDDEWLPSKLSLQLELVESAYTQHGAQDLVVVCPYFYRCAGNPDEVWPLHLPRNAQPLSEFLFAPCSGFQTSTYLCRRELLFKVPFRKGLKKHQDWDWFLQLTALPDFRLLVVPQVLSIYWVADTRRTSISGALDWRYSYEWATVSRDRMTAKAYASFLTRICVRSAMLQNAGPGALAELLRAMFTLGAPTPRLLAEVFLSISLPQSLRARLRSGLQRWRAWRARTLLHSASIEVPGQENVCRL